MARRPSAEEEQEEEQERLGQSSPFYSLVPSLLVWVSSLFMEKKQKNNKNLHERKTTVAAAELSFKPTAAVNHVHCCCSHLDTTVATSLVTALDWPDHLLIIMLSKIVSPLLSFSCCLQRSSQNLFCDCFYS